MVIERHTRVKSVVCSMIYDFMLDPEWVKTIKLPIDVKLNGVVIGQIEEIKECRGSYFGKVIITCSAAQKFLQAYMLQHHTEATFHGA